MLAIHIIRKFIISFKNADATRSILSAPRVLQSRRLYSKLQLAFID